MGVGGGREDLEDGQTAGTDVSCSNFGNSCQCLWTGDRRAPSDDRERIREDGKHEDLHQVCSHSLTDKLIGGVRPATLFTWPRTDVKGIEKNLTAELNAVLLDAFN